MRLIKTQFSMTKWRHCSVKCQFVFVDRSAEGELMLALRSQNEIGRTTVSTNFGQEIFLFQKLAVASKDSLMKDFPQDWIRWIEVELACEKKASKGSWYNAPALLLAMLIWKEDFDLSLIKEMQEINDPSISLPEKEMVARGRIEKIFKERAYKMLAIANPANGQGFFSLLFNFNWIREKDQVGLRRDKVHSLATSKISPERKKEILHSLMHCRVDDVTSEREYYSDG
ncbi:hypothetical protein GOP47_0017590 [Adiantum capillus-veneris]|uniref:Uncharacterized protein n=1 Tax=Adiantum capillus-veneris TaxID=13818 RepID=A0A9D4UG43_ADICA|nr:hypothetical protein GOP47_0017590 [Adiantum capillus-veneris]